MVSASQHGVCSVPYSRCVSQNLVSGYLVTIFDAPQLQCLAFQLFIVSTAPRYVVGFFSIYSTHRACIHHYLLLFKFQHIGFWGIFPICHGWYFEPESLFGLYLFCNSWASKQRVHSKHYAKPLIQSNSSSVRECGSGRSRVGRGLQNVQQDLAIIN